jgi:hypothetical protein
MITNDWQDFIAISSYKHKVTNIYNALAELKTISLDDNDLIQLVRIISENLVLKNKINKIEEQKEEDPMLGNIQAFAIPPKPVNGIRKWWLCDGSVKYGQYFAEYGLSDQYIPDLRDKYIKSAESGSQGDTGSSTIALSVPLSGYGCNVSVNSGQLTGNVQGYSQSHDHLLGNNNVWAEMKTGAGYLFLKEVSLQNVGSNYNVRILPDSIVADLSSDMYGVSVVGNTESESVYVDLPINNISGNISGNLEGTLSTELTNEPKGYKLAFYIKLVP